MSTTTSLLNRIAAATLTAAAIAVGALAIGTARRSQPRVLWHPATGARSASVVVIRHRP
jgi:hypothetical protein